METRKLLDAVTGTGVSSSYFIESQDGVENEENDVYVFVEITGGSATIELSADNQNFVPINEGTLSTNGVKWVSPPEGSYLRVSYAGVTTISATIKPKHASNG